ncbi:hypothetical protein ABZ612_00770 [Streptomyces avermitilis]
MAGRDHPSVRRGLPARGARGVLDWRVLFEAEAEDEIVIGADEHALPGLCFVPIGERRTVKKRLHLDLAPNDQERVTAGLTESLAGWVSHCSAEAARSNASARPSLRMRWSM